MLHGKKWFSDLLCYFVIFSLSLVLGQHLFCEAENISRANVRQSVSYYLKGLFMNAVPSVAQVTLCC